MLSCSVSLFVHPPPSPPREIAFSLLRAEEQRGVRKVKTISGLGLATFLFAFCFEISRTVFPVASPWSKSNPQLGFPRLAYEWDDGYFKNCLFQTYLLDAGVQRSTALSCSFGRWVSSFAPAASCSWGNSSFRGEWACWLAAILIGSAQPQNMIWFFVIVFDIFSRRRRGKGLAACCSMPGVVQYTTATTASESPTSAPNSSCLSQCLLTHQQSPTTCWYLVPTKFGEAVLLVSLTKEFREPEQVSLLCREPIVICT